MEMVLFLNLLHSYSQQSYFISCYRNHPISQGTKDHARYLEKRFKMWEDDNFEDLLSEGIQNKFNSKKNTRAMKQKSLLAVNKEISLMAKFSHS